LLRQFFMGMPKALEEAAMIDGASRWGILFRIAVPLTRPAMITLATFGFLYTWNSFLWPLIIIGNPANKVVSQGLFDLQALYSARRSDHGRRHIGRLANAAGIPFRSALLH
jgi:multiple sugar transport system permease protein